MPGKINHALKLLTIIASVFFMGYFLESYEQTSPKISIFFCVTTELLAIVISLSIFVLIWHTSNKNNDSRSLFLGATMLIIGIFDLYHTLSYPYMPAFITPNSSQKAMILGIAANLAFSLLFLASAFIYKDSLPRLMNKTVLFISVNIINILFLNMILLYTDTLPAMYSDGSLSTAGILLLLLNSAILLYSGYLYSIRLQETGQKSNICLIYGVIILTFGNIAYINYSYSEHLLRAAGYYFIYLALFRSFIEQPYENRVVEEEKLRHEAEERYRNLFENASDAIVTFDLQDRVTSWNKSAEKMFGYTAQEVSGKEISHMIVPANLLTEKELLIIKANSGKKVSGVETLRQRKDGTKINVSLTISPIQDENQNIVGMSNIARDITERKQAEEKLLESEKKYRMLIENIQDGVFIIQDAKMQFVNEAFAKIGGYAMEEIIGKDFRELVAPEDLDLVANRYSRRQAGEDVPKEYEFRILYKDGTRRIVNMNVGLITYQDRIASMGTIKDITERKRAEEQIKASLKEKEILLREIHHRVKNNMQVISSLLRLQSGYIKENGYLGMFKDSQNRIMSMSLVYEKLYRSENLEKINFKEYLKDLVNELFQSYGVEQIKVALDINTEDISLGVDTAIPCGLIINELVTNSLKYAFPDGRKGEIKIALHRTDENEIELAVGDNGVGIPANLDFRNTKSLGLRLVTIMVENQLNGEINLDRSRGTEFKIKFKGGK